MTAKMEESLKNHAKAHVPPPGYYAQVYVPLLEAFQKSGKQGEEEGKTTAYPSLRTRIGDVLKKENEQIQKFQDELLDAIIKGAGGVKAIDVGPQKRPVKAEAQQEAGNALHDNVGQPTNVILVANNATSRQNPIVKRKPEDKQQMSLIKKQRPADVPIKTENGGQGASAVHIKTEAVPIKKEAVPIKTEAVPIKKEAVPIKKEEVHIIID